MCPVGTVQRIAPLHFCHNAPRFRFNQPVMQDGDMCFEVPRRKLLPAVLFLLQEKSQRVRVVGDSFKAFKFSVKRIGIACKILSGGYIPCTVFINQTHRIGGKLLVFDALIMPCIVKLIEITFDFPMFCTCQLDCVSKNTVACLFPIKPPSIVRCCVL